MVDFVNRERAKELVRREPVVFAEIMGEVMGAPSLEVRATTPVPSPARPWMSSWRASPRRAAFATRPSIPPKTAGRRPGPDGRQPALRHEPVLLHSAPAENRSANASAGDALALAAEGREAHVVVHFLRRGRAEMVLHRPAEGTGAVDGCAVGDLAVEQQHVAGLQWQRDEMGSAPATTILRSRRSPTSTTPRWRPASSCVRARSW
jgi:hypothetical protein